MQSLLNLSKFVVSSHYIRGIDLGVDTIPSCLCDDVKDYTLNATRQLFMDCIRIYQLDRTMAVCVRSHILAVIFKCNLYSLYALQPYFSTRFFNLLLEITICLNKQIMFIWCIEAARKNKYAIDYIACLKIAETLHRQQIAELLIIYSLKEIPEQRITIQDLQTPWLSTFLEMYTSILNFYETLGYGNLIENDNAEDEESDMSVE